MSFPFNLFKTLQVSFKGRSNTHEVKQKVNENLGSVQQAGRDIHNHSSQPTAQKSAPLLYISALGWASNQDGVSLMPEFFNGSNEVLFLESIDIVGDVVGFPISIKPQQIERTNLPSRPLPETDEDNVIALLYRDAENNHYHSRHTMTLQARADNKYNFGTDIRFQGPVERIQK